MRLFIITCGILAVLLTASIFAATPTSMNYQGLLTDTNGDPVNDSTYSVVFTIYDAAVSGNPKWTETRDVTTSDGLFSVLLGTTSIIKDTVFNGPSRYLGIKVGADPEIEPRIMMITVPYAFRVSTVDGASGGEISGQVNIGTNNTNVGSSAFVAGRNNDASGDNSTISGGRDNEAANIMSTVSGGGFNTAYGDYASIGGGYYNEASEHAATVSGGQSNTAGGLYAAVGGGSGNDATGSRATVPGGYNNQAAGDYSFAAGRNAVANHSGAFVWSDNSSTDFASTGSNQFLVEADGGVGVGTNSPTTQLDVDGTVKSRSGGFEFPDGTVQTTAAVDITPPPIGGVIAWLKSFSNTPSLPDEYAECNGQTLSDPDSPYNGQTIPNLNGTTGIHRFLRGNTTSGSTGGNLNHDHTVTLSSFPVTTSIPTGFCAPSGTHTTSQVSHLPQYYHVVWVMRIK